MENFMPQAEQAPQESAAKPISIPIDIMDIAALIEIGLRSPHSLAEERWLLGLQAVIAPALAPKTG